MSVTESLKTRYDAVFQSSSDSFFFQNLHHYYDLVEKHPMLAVIMEASHEEYANTHSSFWPRGKSMTDEEADVAEELTLRFERFNLYARASLIKVRVYDIIEDYKTDLVAE